MLTSEMKPETERWLRRAERHLEVAHLEIGASYVEHGIFWCQQALEVLLKGMILERTQLAAPPRTHDLIALTRRLGLALSDDQRRLLRRLTDEYSPTRYPEFEVDVEKETAESYLGESEVLFSWLRSQVT